ncbi:HAD family hydrolase [Streptomyces sp. BE20]|uniref:HAD family hydrolase n=1 Tax=Streptomyces sp. BE20 TaxID=3002525 RepID=UPI002E78A68D|nr:HAD family hydrolase [Streptomyces sp. BE20]MEE1822820.1 HAD family hydrolase [Streptomyces sp. BE20]
MTGPTAPPAPPAPTGAAPARRVRGVVFDLDGTLADSWSLHLRCLRRSVAAVGSDRPSGARLAAAQRPTDLETLAALVPAELLAGAARAYDLALREELAGATSPVPPMPGARELVGLLRAEGLVLGICTGRSRAHARLLLDACGLPLDLTVAREDAARPKPAADGLLLALRRLGLAPEEAVYVGDSPADARQGAAAGVAATFVLGPPGPGRITALNDLPAALREARS